MTAAFLQMFGDALTYCFAVFMVVAIVLGLLLLWLGVMYVARTALLRTLEVAVIVEAAREARRQDRAPILRAWTRLEKRWGNGR